MKARETVKLNVLRGIFAMVTNDLVAKGRGPEGTLTEDEMLTLITRASKQRKDSIQQFEAGGRPELAKAKAAEMGVMDKSGANKLMGMLMKDLKGKADGTAVKAVVDSMFS